MAHSRSPTLHNAALKSAGIDGVYIPYLVDDLRSFLQSFSHSDFKGFSVTIPHKVGRKPPVKRFEQYIWCSSVFCISLEICFDNILL